LILGASFHPIGGGADGLIRPAFSGPVNERGRGAKRKGRHQCGNKEDEANGPKFHGATVATDFCGVKRWTLNTEY